MQTRTIVIRMIDTGGIAKTLMQTQEAGRDFRFVYEEESADLKCKH